MGFLMIVMMKFKGAAIVNILWSGGIAIGSVLLGYYYFHEKLTFLQLVGIFIVIVGMIFIELFKAWKSREKIKNYPWATNSF